MKWGEVVGEATRNVWSGVTRPVFWLAAFVAFVGGVMVVDLRALVDLNQQVNTWRESGAAIATVAAAGAVDGAACDALQRTAGVTAAGAGRAVDGGLVLPALPMNPPRLLEITPGFVRLISGPAHTDRAGGASQSSVGPGELLLSHSLASILDRGQGSVLVTGQGSARVAGVYAVPDDGRDRGLSYSALSPVPALGSFDFCWAEVWPPSETVTALLRSAVAVRGSAEVQIVAGQYNPTLGSRLEVRELYSGRHTRHAPLAAAVAGLLMGLVSMWLRRLEIASALHAGVPRWALTCQLLLETLAWLSVALLLAACAVVYAARVGNPFPPGSGVLVALAGLSAGTGGVLVGVLTGVAAIREDHLFRLYKNR